MMRERSQATAGGWAQAYAYFAAVCHQLAHETDPTPPDTPPDRDDAVGRLFHQLTSREFTYLTRRRCEPYRPPVEAHLRRAIAEGGPVTFYFDIGGGYRASLQPDQLTPTCTPGLGELLALYQVRNFIRCAQPDCPVPIRFTLVIDNLCALYVNGIPLDWTQYYCAALRAVLRHFELDSIDLLVESEHIDRAEYERDFEATLAQTEPPDTLTPTAQDNVERFLGRRLSAREACAQIARYAAGSATTEAGLARIVDGIRLTQRATTDTLAFRPFPGGDQRIQCGEVGLAARSERHPRPVLLSSANYERYHKEPVDVAEWAIPHLDTISLLY